MPVETFERAVAESRSETAAALRESLRNAAPEVLAKLAVDLVPHLFHPDYHGQPWRTGETWAEALAVHDAKILPSHRVRVQIGAVTADDFEELLMVDAAQIALAVVGPPVAPDVRAAFGSRVPWLLDADGLIHLMITSRVGVTSRTYDATYVDDGYFR